MEPNDRPAIEFTVWDGEDALRQRDAALNILQKLVNFFNTDDLTEIDDMIDDERLTNDTSGLTGHQAEEALAYLEEIEAQAKRGQSVINDNLNNRSRW